ncbi:hypothetical protein ACFUIY_03020 [Streptomyces griseorubiginosus]|uniref:hypothetical protein n=1 Tax=Streptomyces griseorubiginosus TaxID=67304 RepID=UPI00114027C0|nr:hypothetical protein [Streptomyces griseorubiginosus]
MTKREKSVKKRIGLAVLVAGLLATAALGLRSLLYAEGWVGTIGTYRASSCDYSSGEGAWNCSGTFVSSDGRVDDPRAEVSLSGDAKGRSVRVNSSGDGDYQEIGGFAVAGAVSLILFGAGPLAVVAALELRKRHKSSKLPR